ncbi:hypothetical protein WMF38_56940 [Sorangium sp. So ce118]
MKKSFKRDYLVGILNLPDECIGGEIISDRMVDHRRWSIVREVVFRIPEQAPGEAWRTTYRVPATECQEERLWEYDEEVECVLVRAVEKTVTVWEPAG